MSTIDHFRRLHESGFFVMPNAWDVGSAVRLEHIGFSAIATTSSGFAASLGRKDQETTFAELCAHVEAIVTAIDVPLSVDGERLFADHPDQVAANVAEIARLGAAGVSIEDYNPGPGTIDHIDRATERVAAAASVTRPSGMVLTARAENQLYGLGDLDDTITRLRRYADAGADVVYAPGIVDPAAIRRLVAEVGVPVNILLLPDTPSPAELANLGVRRASTGGRLAFTAYEAMESRARELL